MSKANTTLVNQINIIKFDDGTNITYLPPNKSYKMLRVQINTMLYFRDHLKHVTTNVRLIAKVLKPRKNYPPKLLKSEYHATYLGIFTNKQLEIIVDKLLNKAARNAIG
jgi:hypothetical protein